MSDSTAPENTQTESTPTANKIPVTVDIDPAELRDWAMRHASSGHLGVAHVLFEAADRYDNLVGRK